VRDEFEARKLDLSVMTYDDLVTGCARRCPARRPRDSRAVRHRYDVVLVDEFQTRPGPVGHHALRIRRYRGDVVLIAIPSRRSTPSCADVYAYLRRPRRLTTGLPGYQLAQ